MTQNWRFSGTGLVLLICSVICVKIGAANGSERGPYYAICRLPERCIRYLVGAYFLRAQICSSEHQSTFLTGRGFRFTGLRARVSFSLGRLIQTASLLEAPLFLSGINRESISFPVLKNFCLHIVGVVVVERSSQRVSAVAIASGQVDSDDLPAARFNFRFHSLPATCILKCAMYQDDCVCVARAHDCSFPYQRWFVQTLRWNYSPRAAATASAVSVPEKFCCPVIRLPSRIANPRHRPA